MLRWKKVFSHKFFICYSLNNLDFYSSAKRNKEVNTCLQVSDKFGKIVNKSERIEEV